MSAVKTKDVPKVLDLLLAYMHSTNNLATAFRETGSTFSQYKNVFNAVANDIENGNNLKDALNNNNAFSAEVSQLIYVGNTSGKLEEVITLVSKSLKYMLTVSSGVVTAVAFQGALLISMVVLAPYLLFLVASQSAKKTGFLAESKEFMVTAMETVPYIEFGYPVAIILGVAWMVFHRNARAAVMQAISVIPFIKSALVNYQTGSWCRYMAMMASAGLTLDESERLLRGTLLPGLSVAFEKVFSQIDKGWEVATTFEEGDPREEIPRLVMTFIKSGGFSGQLDSQLNIAAEYQLDEAAKQFQNITKVVGFTVMILVAIGVTALGSQVYSSRF